MVNWNEAIKVTGRTANLPTPMNIERKVDKEVSAIVGKQVMLNDPRLIQLVVKWKNKTKNGIDNGTPDNFKNNEQFIKELKATFNGKEEINKV